MVNVFCKLIIAKLKSFEEVPSKDKPAVHIALVKLGYDDEGDLIVN